jgi:hypothetical protein
MKTCKAPECNYPVFSHLYCQSHQYLRKDKKKPKRINQRSAKESKRLAKYSIVRAEYLAEHPICEVCEVAESNQIHHKFGRISWRLTDKKRFLAVCPECHKYVELNPIWAKEKGYSLNRL